MINSGLIVGLGILVVFLAASIRFIKEWERGIVLRLGRAVKTELGAGPRFLIPMIDQLIRVDLREVTMDVPSQDVITRDNVTVKVNAVVYFKVVSPSSAVLKVEHYLFATSQYAQTTLRSICGQEELDNLLIDRERLNQAIQRDLDAKTDEWGIKVTAVEIKQIDLPTDMQRAMAKQAEAERERRAKVIHATGELQAAGKLAEAADVMANNPITIQLRYLQTLSEIATENNSTTLFPIPIDIFNKLSS